MYQTGLQSYSAANQQKEQTMNTLALPDDLGPGDPQPGMAAVTTTPPDAA